MSPEGNRDDTSQRTILNCLTERLAAILGAEADLQQLRDDWCESRCCSQPGVGTKELGDNLVDDERANDRVRSARTQVVIDVVGQFHEQGIELPSGLHS